MFSIARGPGGRGVTGPGCPVPALSFGGNSSGVRFMGNLDGSPTVSGIKKSGTQSFKECCCVRIELFQILLVQQPKMPGDCADTGGEPELKLVPCP